MMPDSLQLTILKRLTTQLEGVSIANGYDFELTGKVFRGRRVFGDEVSPPFMSVLESPKPGDSLEADDEKLVRNTQWHLLTQGWATDEKDHPLDVIYGLKASVEQRLARVVQLNRHGRPEYPNEYLFGGLIIAMHIGPGVCYPPPDAASKAFFFLPLSIDYAEDLSNPFM